MAWSKFQRLPDPQRLTQVEDHSIGVWLRKLDREAEHCRSIERIAERSADESHTASHFEINRGSSNPIIFDRILETLERRKAVGEPWALSPGLGHAASTRDRCVIPDIPLATKKLRLTCEILVTSQKVHFIPLAVW